MEVPCLKVSMTACYSMLQHDSLLGLSAVCSDVEMWVKPMDLAALQKGTNETLPLEATSRSMHQPQLSTPPSALDWQEDTTQNDHVTWYEGTLHVWTAGLRS